MRPAKVRDAKLCAVCQERPAVQGRGRFEAEQCRQCMLDGIRPDAEAASIAAARKVRSDRVGLFQSLRIIEGWQRSG